MTSQASNPILSDLPVNQLADGLAGRERPGEGDKVLWLHGYTLDSSSWGDLWQRLPGWHHIGVDFPGHGASGPLSEAGDLQKLARRLGEYCLENEIRHIAALSFGTITATQIMIEFPDSFTSVVLSAPSLAGGRQEPDVAQVYMQLFQLYHQHGPGKEMADVWLACRVWDAVDQFPGLPEALRTLVEKHSWDEMQSYAMRHFTQPAQTEESLKKVSTSLLVMIGEHEMAPFRESAEILQQSVAGSKIVELPGAAHLCLLQTPELAAKTIDQHLRENAKNPPPASAS
ncbi:MAG: alpha/beta fold hydrolase [Rubripirellula sp.]